MNKLYYGNNLDVLRDAIATESVDLIYLDPPFNSKRDYNLLFKSPKAPAGGAAAYSEAQIEAFKDTWHWGAQAEKELNEVLKGENTVVAGMLKAFLGFVGRNDMMAYLTMMANRLLELHRVLKPTGSLYLHCDSTASHYLKLLLDAVFGKEMFQNEIIWKRSSAHNDAKQGARHFGRITDTILFYTKSESEIHRWNPLHRDYDEKYVNRDYRRRDPDGRYYRLDNIQGPGGASKGNPYYEVMGVSRHWRYSKKRMQELIDANRIVQTQPGAVPQYKRYLDEMGGVPIQNLWDDVPVINNRAAEFLGYPTQKPLALLERILSASSVPGDVVLDPFCGCGTAVHAAQKLRRQWIGIDITCLAISLIEMRLKSAFGKRCEFEVKGTPKDLESARDLARRDKYQFQWWAISLINEAQPWKGKKKGADTGIDGIRYFRDLDRKEFHTILISVKGGENVGPAMVKDLIATLARDKADIGLFITLAPPTKAMLTESAAAGFYTSPNGKKYARLQLLTIEGLLDGTQRAEHPDYEPDTGFKKAKAEHSGEQTTLL